MGKKKATYNYRTEAEAQQASALEDFLFGGAALGKLLAGGDEAAPIADLVKQVSPGGSACCVGITEWRLQPSELCPASALNSALNNPL